MTIPVSRDTWVSAVGEEQEGNNGASSRLKFKGIQEFTLLDGDFSAIQGPADPTGRPALAPGVRGKTLEGDGLDDLCCLGGRNGNELRQGARGGVLPLAGRRAGHHGGHSRQRRLDLEIRRCLRSRCRRMAVDPRRPGRDPGAARRTQPGVRGDGRRGQRVDPTGRCLSLAAVPQPLLLFQGPERLGGPAVRGLGHRRRAGGGAPLARSAATKRCLVPAGAEEDRPACDRHARGGKGPATVDGRRRSVRPAAGRAPCGEGRDGVAGCPHGGRRKARTSRAGRVLGKTVLRRGPRRRLGAVRRLGKAIASRTGPSAIAGWAIGWRKSSSPSPLGRGGIRFDSPSGARCRWRCGTSRCPTGSRSSRR